MPRHRHQHQPTHVSGTRDRLPHQKHGALPSQPHPLSVQATRDTQNQPIYRVMALVNVTSAQKSCFIAQKNKKKHSQPSREFSTRCMDAKRPRINRALHTYIYTCWDTNSAEGNSRTGAAGAQRSAAQRRKHQNERKH